MKKRSMFTMLLVLFLCASSVYSQTKVIAHRGYWDCEGSAQNSVTALNKAHEVGAYGSEFDVSITADGIPVVNHDDSIQGFCIETSLSEVEKRRNVTDFGRIPDTGKEKSGNSAYS